MTNLVKKFLTKEDLAAIVASIGEAEKTTAGEIRVSIRQKRRRREKMLSIEEMARREFHELGMTKTKDHTGILIFLLIEDKKFFILADAGIYAKVEGGTWSGIAAEISTHFSGKNFRQGLIEGIQAAGKVLSKFFPRKANDTNELPNEVRLQ
jgi:uncharacterized membrane protein